MVSSTYTNSNVNFVPCLNLVINSFLLDCLVDTGSSASILAADYVGNLPLIPATNVRFQMANKNTSTPLGYVCASVQFSGSQLALPMLVMPHLVFPAILGTDFLCYTRAVLSFDEQSYLFCFNNHQFSVPFQFCRTSTCS